MPKLVLTTLLGDLNKVKSSTKELNSYAERFKGELNKLENDRAFRKLSIESQELVRRLQGLIGKTRTLTRERERAVDPASAKKKTEQINKEIQKIKTLTTSYNKLKRELKDVKTTQGKVTAATDTAAVSQDGVNKVVGKSNMLFRQLRGVMLSTFGAYAVIRGMKDTVKIVADFELGIAKVRAITGATRAETDKLSRSAIKLGGSGIFSPKVVTQLQLQLAKLGFSIDEIAQSTEGIIQLAIATGEELTSTTTLVASTIRGMGYTASETQRIVDVMAKGFTTSALDVAKFRESIKYIAPVAKRVGIEIEGVTAILGKLADAQIYGSLAGTGMRNIFLAMADANGKLYEKVGFTVRSFDDFVRAMKMLNKQGVGMSEMLQIFNKRAVTAALVIADNADVLEDYRDKMKDANGVAEEMSDIQMETLANQAKVLGNRWHEFILTVQSSGGLLKDFAGGLGILLKEITDSLKSEEAKALDDLESFLKEWDDIAKGSERQPHKFDVGKAEIKTLEKRLKSLNRELKGLTKTQKEIEEHNAKIQAGGQKWGLGRESEERLKALPQIIEAYNDALTNLKEKEVGKKFNKELEKSLKDFNLTFDKYKKTGISDLAALEKAWEEATDNIMWQVDAISKKIKEKPKDRFGVPIDLTGFKKEKEKYQKLFDEITKVYDKYKVDINKKTLSSYELEQKYLKFTHEFNVIRNNMMKDGFEKEIAIEAERHRFRSETLKLNKRLKAKNISDIEQYDKLIEQETQRHFNALEKLKRLNIEDSIKGKKKILKSEYDLEKEKFKAIKNTYDKEVRLSELERDYKIGVLKEERRLAIGSAKEIEAIDNRILTARQRHNNNLLKINGNSIDRTIKLEKEKNKVREAEAEEKLAKDIVIWQKNGDNEVEIKRKTAIRKAEIDKGVAAADLATAQLKLELLEENTDVTDVEIELLKLKLKELQADLAVAVAKVEELKGETEKDGKSFFEKNFSKIMTGAGRLVDAYGQIADAAVAKSERIVDALNTQVSEQQSALDAELRLAEQGLANNVSLKKKELEESKKLRDQAIREREKELKKKEYIESVSQSIDLTSSAASIFKGFTKFLGGFGVPLAIIAIAGMLQAFKGFSADASAMTKYDSGGWELLAGASHSNGGISLGENREAQGGEMLSVFNKKATQKHQPFIAAITDAINKDKLDIFLNKDSLKDINKTDISVNQNVNLNDDGEISNIKSLLSQSLKRKNVRFDNNRRVEQSGTKTRIIILR